MSLLPPSSVTAYFCPGLTEANAISPEALLTEVKGFHPTQVECVLTSLIAMTTKQTVGFVVFFFSWSSLLF